MLNIYVTEQSCVMTHISISEITCSSQLRIPNGKTKKLQRQTFPLGRAASPPLVSPGFLWSEVDFRGRYLRKIL